MMEQSQVGSILLTIIFVLTIIFQYRFLNKIVDFNL